MKLYRSMVLVSSDEASLERGAQEVFQRLQQEINAFGLQDEINVSMVSDIGRHDAIPMVIVYPEAVIYGPVHVEDVHYLVEEHLLKGRIAAGLQASTRELRGALPGSQRAKARSLPNSALCSSERG
jgi:(2Fe-2S) ferredoxin